MDDGNKGASRQVTKKLSLDISYSVGRQDPTRGVFEGGVPEPDHVDELRMDISPDLVYDPQIDDLVESGKYQLNLRGSRRAYWAFARYLLTLCELPTEDPDYHDHFDQILNADGHSRIHMIVHRPIDAGLS